MLLRQIREQFYQNEVVLVKAFIPTKRDEGLLSVDDSNKIIAEEAYRNFTSKRGCDSVGVYGVEEDECTRVGLVVQYSNKPHTSINFNVLDKCKWQDTAMQLTVYANERGWLYRPGK